MWNASSGAIVQPTDFGSLLARAPRINEQGGSLSQVPLANARLASEMIDSGLRAGTALEAERIRGETLEKTAKINAGGDTSTGDRLRSALTLLGTGGGLLGGGGGLFGGGNRFAGDALSGLLSTPLTTPSDVLNNFNGMTNGLNTSRGLIEPWTAQSAAMTRSAVSRSGG
jgi:hypothetical protein